YLGYENISLVCIYLAYRKLRIMMPFSEYCEKVEKLFEIPKKKFVSMYFVVLNISTKKYRTLRSKILSGNVDLDFNFQSNW
ncbi:MAG: hypothetical protein OWQ55_10025, partial [Sulfuracidifex metallicus]|nr:hypothetical protein [Sulfuracidifex metallicus]